MAAARPGRAVGVLAAAVLVAGVVAAAAVPAGAAPRADDPPPTAPADARVVLIVHASGDAADVRATATAADATSSAIDVRHTFPAVHAFSVRVPAGQRAAAVAALRATPGVTGIEAPVTRSFSFVPDDPDYHAQAAYLSSVHAPQAWDVTHGSRAVRIAVVDSGIDVGHPDLAGKVVGAYNADDGSSNITDEVGHGTFVAGVAAARTDNRTGVAGAGYDTSLLGVKIAGADGELSLDDEIAGINWAVRNGADIINLSLGGTGYSTAEKNAVENAIAHGVLVVAAAGNDGTAVKQYPAAYPGVIAVGAVNTSKHKRATFSSYGPWVTLAAPGVDIESTSPRKGSSFFATRSGYARADGTSFSAPLVAGEAALLKATDPALTVAHLRQALVASAGGYSGQGLGAGQVDFAGALTHLPPAAGPLTTGTVGAADRVNFTAATLSPAVEFRVDTGSWTAPVATSGATASLPYDTWGLANGSHTLHARACSSHGECGAAEVTAGFVLANTAPRVLTPAAGSTSTGLFTITAEHSSGGGAELLLDGRPAGTAHTSPFTFAVNGSRLTDGSHTVQVVSCSTSGLLCHGPSSDTTTIDTRSLHPAITALVKPAISPNGDRAGDTATLRFTLPDTEQVTAETSDSTGTVVRSAVLGTLTAGAHTWTWRGQADSGARLADGRYTIAVRTTSPAGSSSTTPDGYATLDGYAATTGTVDTVAPRLSGLTGKRSGFYPVVDHYRDTFAPGVTVGNAGTLALTIRTGRGAVVRTLTAARGAGRTSLTWNGRNARGRLVPAGNYRWQYSVTDAAGNRSVAANNVVVVSLRRLVSRVSYVSHRAASYRAAGGTDACATARTRSSAFPHGVALRNSCSVDTGDFAYATYGFTVPGAIRYSKVAFQVYGHAAHRAELSVAVDRVDGGIEIPAYVQVSRRSNHWYSIASVPAAGHINAKRRTYATILLTGRYPGTNTFDTKYARLRVSYTALG